MKSSEQWKPIPGFTRYMVSDLGRVVSVVRGNKPISTIRPGNYRWFGAVPDGRKKVRGRGAVALYVHRAVLLAFVGPCPLGMEAIHRNGDRSSNALSNLRWGTKPENSADTVKHGVHKGSRNGRAKLDERMVRTIKCLAREDVRLSTIARAFGVTPTVICRIVHGRSWSHA